MKNCDLIIKGKYLLTMNKQMDIIDNGAIAISAGKIIAIGNIDEIEREYKSNNIISTPDGIVMPGLINTHTHVGMTYFRGLADDLSLDEWLNKHIWPAEARYVNADFVKDSSELGCLEMIKAGITCFNDMYFFEEVTAEVAKKIGMRVVLGEGILNFPTPSCKNSEETIAKTLTLIKKYEHDNLIKVALAPHSIYACDQEILAQVKKIADEQNLLIHIHIAETKKEVADAQRDYKLSPVVYLDEMGFLDNKVIAAHCVWLDDNDLSIIKKRQVKISHNPISNMKLASGVAPIYRAWQEHKIVVGLGTDSAASNNTLDLFSDIRVAALLQKVSNDDPVALSSSDIVSMATIGGAEVLGMEKEIGSLEIGKQADIITINLDQPHLQPVYNPYSHLVYCANAGDVNDVVINGKVIMRNREVQTAGEEKILTKTRIFNEKKQAIDKIALNSSSPLSKGRIGGV